MMYKFYGIIIMSVLFTQCTKKTTTGIEQTTPPKSNTTITIAFGSCNDQDKDQPLWDDIIAEKPDIWVWLGDNIYGDTADVTAMKAMYDMQNAQPDYATLKNQTTVIGTWDDHDYGKNNAGKEWAAKETHQQALLDFLDVPANDVRRTRAGVYGSHTIEKEGISVTIYLLDARYFRDEPQVVMAKHVPTNEGTVLGEEQWKWLERKLESSTADVHIFASGIQVIPSEHIYEKWANFPHEKQRLLDLISNTKVPRPIFISGDRHIGEISKESSRGNTFYDLTSSSLTHGWKIKRKEANAARIGDIVYDLNYGLIEISKKEAIEIRGSIKGDGQVSYEQLVLEY